MPVLLVGMWKDSTGLVVVVLSVDALEQRRKMVALMVLRHGSAFT